MQKFLMTAETENLIALVLRSVVEEFGPENTRCLLPQSWSGQKLDGPNAGIFQFKTFATIRIVAIQDGELVLERCWELEPAF